MKVHFDIPEDMLIDLRTFMSGRDYFVGTYYRVVEDHGKRCVEYILYFTIQRFTPHPYDYEPIFVYDDRVIYDKMHYNTGMVPGKWREFTVIFPWNSITHYKIPLSRKLELKLKPLTDEIIERWWSVPGKGQFLIRQKILNPWSVRTTFRDEITCPVCGKTHVISGMEVKKNTLQWEGLCHGKKINVQFDIKTRRYTIVAK